MARDRVMRPRSERGLGNRRGKGRHTTKVAGSRSVQGGLRRLFATGTALAFLIVSATAMAADETATTSTTNPQATSTSTSLPSTEGTQPTAEPVDAPTLPAPPIVFPVAGEHSFRDTFGAPRDGGRRKHQGIDIFAARATAVVAVANGTIEEVGVGRLAGQYIVVRHDDGWRSKYLHLNNDSPGTDDGLAIGYAAGIEVGVRVEVGTVIGFVGDSGNAESTSPHLHFELRQPDGRAINPYDALVDAPSGGLVSAEPSTHTPPAAPAVETFNTTPVGHLNPDGVGFNADLSVNGEYVFMGTWGRPGRCPGTGVRVIDVSAPTQPEKVAALAGADEFPGTAAETVWAGDVDTSDYQGAVAVIGLRLCENNWRGRLAAEFAGLAIYDVSVPDEPVLISTVHSGESTQGVHSLDVLSQDDALVVAATIPQSHLHHPDGVGDVRLYDLSDPSAPVGLSDWDFRRDGPSDLVGALLNRVGDEAMSGHSVTWMDPSRILVAHSAAGVVMLDVSDPTAPVYVSAASPYDSAELESVHEYDRGHGHSAHSGWVFGSDLLVQDDQHLQPGGSEDGAWGRQVLYDVSDPGEPRQLSTFGTESSQPGEDGEVGRDGFYSAHRSRPFGDQYELVSWFSDGVRIVDLLDPAEPLEVARFVPPPSSDPQGWWIAPDGTREFPMVWGAIAVGEMVYASDVNSGLWIFRVTLDDLSTDPSVIPD